MDRFSPNMLKTFQQCPQKYNLKYVQKISMPQKSEIFEKGKKIHAIANYYLKNEDITKFEKALTKEELAIWQLLKQNEYFNKKCVATEYDLTCKIGDFWIGGRIDAIVKDETQYYILDFKTGSIPQDCEFDFQTIVYLLCVEKYFREKVSFIYIDLKNNVNHKIDLVNKKEYEEKILAVLKQIQTAKTYPKTKNCKNCEYLKIC